MKHIPFLLFYISSCIAGAFYPSHNLDVFNKLKESEESSPNAQIFNLGKSSKSDEEVYALKISDNVSEEEDEPTWIVTGVIHGSEIMGINIVFQLIDDLLQQYDTNDSVKTWVDTYEIWFIPTVNPLGFNNRMRKNGHNDSLVHLSGVDLNRNFNFRWDQGGSDNPLDSRFRGIDSASENEVQLLQNLYLDQKPVFGITFHQGNEPAGGQIMRPWSGAPEGTPDYEVLSNFANLYADWVYEDRLPGPFCQPIFKGNTLQDPQGIDCTSQSQAGYCKNQCWRPAMSTMGAYGQSSVWAYAKSRTIDFTVEISDRLFTNHTFLTDSSLILSEEDSTYLAINQEFIRNHVHAMKKWFDHFIHSYNPLSLQGPGITGTITNQLGTPTPAMIEMEGLDNTLTSPHTNDSTFGRYTKLLADSGTYVMMVTTDETQIRDTILVNKGPLTVHNIIIHDSSITSSSSHTLSSQFFSSSTAISSSIRLSSSLDTPFSAGESSSSLLFNSSGQLSSSELPLSSTSSSSNDEIVLVENGVQRPTIIMQGKSLNLIVKEATQLTLFDLQGKVVRKSRINSSTSINLSTLKSGLYFAELNSANSHSFKTLYFH